MGMINFWFSNNIYKIGVKPMETIEFQSLNSYTVYYTEW